MQNNLKINILFSIIIKLEKNSIISFLITKKNNYILFNNNKIDFIVDEKQYKLRIFSIIKNYMR